MKKLLLVSGVFVVLAMPAHAEMGMMGEQKAEMKQQEMKMGGGMPMMQMCAPMMKQMMGQGMMMRDMMQMMKDMMKMERMMITGVKPSERKEIIAEMDKMMKKMDEMMSDMRGMMMHGMGAPAASGEKKSSSEEGEPIAAPGNNSHPHVH